MDAFEELLAALDRVGLWSDIAEVEKRSLRSTLSEGEDVTWTSGAATRADGEDLAEGHVETWLRALAGPLRECGVDLRVETLMSPHERGSTGYTVAINGAALSLYMFAVGEPGLPTTRDPWTDCTLLPAAAVNRELTGAGSRQRLAVFWPGGNDGFAILGDEDVLRQIQRMDTSWQGVIP